MKNLKGEFVFVDGEIIGGINEIENDVHSESFKKLAEKYGFTLNESLCLNREAKNKTSNLWSTQRTIQPYSE